MNEQERMVEGNGTHIWLRYATTVVVNSRPRTIEMGIPFPIGADDALREQLLREANAGMNQLMSSVENRVAQLLQQIPPTQGTIPTPTPAAKPSVTPPPRPRPATPSTAPAPSPSTAPVAPTAPAAAQQPSQQPAQYTTSQSPASQQVREVRESREVRETRDTREPEKEQEREVTSSTGGTNGQNAQSGQSVRQHTGMNLPSMSELSNNVSLPQFIQYINEHLGMTPKQAMEVLKVKSLSGINLRDALEQLQHVHNGQNEEDSEGTIERGRAGTTDPSMRAINDANGQRAERAERVERVDRGERGDERPSKPEMRNASGQQGQQASLPKQPIPFRPATNRLEEARPNSKILRESPAYFDEEDDESDGQSDIEDELDELLDDGNEDEQQGLTPQERVQASGLVSRLRESQGVATVNPARLKVLGNVTDGQIDAEQLDELIQGVWGISSTKRLKVDQAEALISWAKEDDFQNEAEIVLMFLEEDALARGNR